MSPSDNRRNHGINVDITDLAATFSIKVFGEDGLIYEEEIGAFSGDNDFIDLADLVTELKYIFEENINLRVYVRLEKLSRVINE